jgi:glycosyltransferase involved in cell wall biosynthesis
MKVLFVTHGHPAIRPGGAEGYAFELYQALSERPDFEPIFLARAARPDTELSPRHRDAVIASATTEPNQYLMYTDRASWDALFERRPEKSMLTNDFRDFLLAQRPDVIHFQHTWQIGYDAIRVARNTLPDAAILYTLHDFIPICHHNGQMVRTKGNQLCRKGSPRRCHECFPWISPAKFFVRERFIKSQFELVDRFIAPSQTLRERYIDWGLSPEKVLFDDYGRLPATPLPEPDRPGPRNRFAYFGQFTAFKGADLLLEAMGLLEDDFQGHLWIHGANLDLQHEDFQKRMGRMLDETRDNVTVVGPYERSRIPRLMSKIDWVIVPSIWWENSPLVIQEAFQHGRPVICSDIGGMAEKVKDGVSGLHFRRGDAQHLAETIRRAADSPGLWEKLRSGIPPVHSMDDHIARLREIYKELISERQQLRDFTDRNGVGSGDREFARRR